RGTEIIGLDRAASVPGVQVFQAGTELSPDGRLLAAGGRVLTVCATAPALRTARDAAYGGQGDHLAGGVLSRGYRVAGPTGGPRRRRPLTTQRSGGDFAEVRAAVLALACGGVQVVGQTCGACLGRRRVAEHRLAHPSHD